MSEHFINKFPSEDRFKAWLSALLVSSYNMCRIATGTYTGDGATSKAITGLGFTPKYVRIWLHNTAAGDQVIIEKTDQHATTFADKITVESGADQHDEITTVDDALISLDSDGFSVDDAGADSHPNKNAQVYDYLAIG